jgi:nucleoside phosphorylase
MRHSDATFSHTYAQRVIAALPGAMEYVPLRRFPCESFPGARGGIVMSAEFAIGIISALPVESVAVDMVLDEVGGQPAPGDPHRYRSGRLPSTEPDRPHRVVVAVQTRDGTRGAAAIGTAMLRSFPSLRVLVMCGIAGGVPAPHAPLRHVRLGDVVVATDGVVDYDHVRTVDGVDSPRRPVPGLSATLLRADRELEMKELHGQQPWRRVLRDAVRRNAGYARPPDDTDVLFVGGERAPHPAPAASGHAPGRPRIHRGTIGSADRLLRDAAMRDRLAARFRIRAVEMEGSGLAAGADLHDRHWFMVRGIADYCDDNTKNDRWHPYASLAAAAYLRALLAECPPFAEPSPGAASAKPVRAPGAAPAHSADRQRATVEALLELAQMRDDYQRRAILALLPEHIRTAIPDSVVGRLHVVALVDTCQRYPDGRDALISALDRALGAESPEFLRLAAVIRENWSGR